MADYHIYLHSNTSSSIKSHTEPKEETMGGAFSTIQTGIAKVQQFSNSGFQSYISTGVAALSKAIPPIALAIAVAKITDKVVSTGFGHLESYTGHYEYSLAYNNFKSGVGALINPIGTAKRLANIYLEQDKFNRRQEQVKSLVGQINTIGV